MAKLYCDNSLYSTTLEWGTAQEGDGTAKTKATPATVSIDLTGISAVNGNTLAVAGRVVTVTGSYSEGALADHLASLINASTGTVTAAATNWPTPQLRDFAYARGPSNGAPTNTLQIMTRAGSATYNANSLCAVVSSEFTGGSVDAQFSGGVGGAFAYSMRTGSGLFPSHSSTTHYGILFGGTRLAGAFIGGDQVIVRAGETAIKNASAGNTTIGLQDCAIVFDGGVEWDSDAGLNKVSNLVLHNTNSVTCNITCANNSVIEGHRHLDDSLSFRINFTGTQTFNYYFSFSNIFSTRVRWKSIEIDASTGNTSSNQYVIVMDRSVSGSSENKPTFVDCNFWLHANGSSMSNIGGNYATYADFIGGNVGYKPGLTPSSSTAFLRTIQSGSEVSMSLRGVTFHNFVPGSQILSATSMQTAKLFVQDCVLNNVDVTQVYGAPTSVFSSGGNREYFYRPSSSVGYSQWKAAQGYPTLNARLPNLQPWSIMAVTLTSGVTASNSLDLPRMIKEYSEVSGNVAITMEFLFDKFGLVPAKNKVWFDVTYQDANDVLRHETTFDASGDDCELSSSTWAPESNGDPYLGALVFAKYKVSLVTKWPVKTGTNVSLSFSIGQSQQTNLQRWIIDPDVSIVRVGP